MSLKEILKKIISIQSYSGNEKELADYIKNYFKEKNAKVYENDGNIVVHLKKGSNNAIIFNAHMDTIKVQDLNEWQTNPFELTEKEGKYFGLGVSDEKVSIAILMDMFNELNDSKIDVFLVFVKMEEVDGSGSKSFAEYFKNNYKYDKSFCVICEPRNAKFIGLGNKGNIFFEIFAEGKSVHSSTPEYGENAIDKVIKKIQILKNEFHKYQKDCEKLGKATIACPTIINGGSSINTIPNKCTAHGDIRTNVFCHKEMLGLLKKYNGFIKIISSNEPYLLDEKNEIVKMFEAIGITKKTYTTGSNDALFFGKIGIPSIVFGAGNEEMCHKPNEFVEIDNINKTKKTYIELVKSFK